MEYDILVAKSSKEIIELVKQKIKDGWEPLGGAEMLYTNKGGIIYNDGLMQTMIKKSNP